MKSKGPPVATKTFALNTEPHVAHVGDTALEFRPEVMGDDFMEAYAGLREAQQANGLDVENLASVDPSQLRGVHRSLRTFLAALMLPESAELFLRLDVVKAEKVLSSFDTVEAAEAAAKKAKGGARVIDGLRLPDRVLVELLEWVVELYGGGQRPPTSSGGSAPASPPAGRRGMGVSPSKGSTRARGR